MRVLVTGKNGQLGWELTRLQPDGAELLAFNSSELDITDSDTVSSIINQYQPDVVINAAAYTAVDKAESDQTAAYASTKPVPEILPKRAKQFLQN